MIVGFMVMDEALVGRPSCAIRSFVLRRGHFSKAQQRYISTDLPRWRILYRPALVNLDALFCRVAPTIVDIGFGNGEATATIAAANPQKNFLAIEVHLPGVANLLKLIEEQQLNNVRIICHDAVEIFAHMLQANSVAGVHLYFPDPWPKKRHHKRRLVQANFVHKLCKCLKSRAYIHMATDWEAYAWQMLAVLSDQSELCNAAQGFIKRPDWRPLTKFEQRGKLLGHNIWDLLFYKR